MTKAERATVLSFFLKEEKKTSLKPLMAKRGEVYNFRNVREKLPIKQKI